MRIAVCDDDELCLKDECALITETASEMGIDCEAECFTDPAELISVKEKYEIIFLDVEMKSMSGIEAAEMIHKQNSGALIFFVTNHEGYMDEALNKHAFRFWIKPINKQRLVYGIESALVELRNADKYLQVMIEGKLARVPVGEIIYAYAENKSTRLVTKSGIVAVKEPFKNVVMRLPAEFFCRSHASYCINMNYVVRYDKSNVVCRCGEIEYTAYMSKRYYSAFSRRFICWAGDHI